MVQNVNNCVSYLGFWYNLRYLWLWGNRPAPTFITIKSRPWCLEKSKQIMPNAKKTKNKKQKPLTIKAIRTIRDHVVVCFSDRKLLRALSAPLEPPAWMSLCQQQQEMGSGTRLDPLGTNKEPNTIIDTFAHAALYNIWTPWRVWRHQQDMRVH